MASSIEKVIASTFMEMAQGLESGQYGRRPKIALTGMGSEHGEENSMQAAVMAAKQGVDVYYIGTLEAEGVTTIKVTDDEEGHKKMEDMLKNKEIDGAVTMHFPFPIGVSTVGAFCNSCKRKRNVHRQYNRNFQYRSYRRNDQERSLWCDCSKGMWNRKTNRWYSQWDGARQTEKALKELQSNGWRYCIC